MWQIGSTRRASWSTPAPTCVSIPSPVCENAGLIPVSSCLQLTALSFVHMGALLCVWILAYGGSFHGDLSSRTWRDQSTVQTSCHFTTNSSTFDIDSTTLTVNGDQVGTSGGQIKVLAGSARYHTTLLDFPEIICPAGVPRDHRYSIVHHIRPHQPLRARGG